MLTSDTLLQDRYRILRKIGGGGMGEVYLAEDTRLPGRRCAIKEMSPAQLPAEDRNWAINAFRQEAQMLANISHSGLTPVTDFFPEKGNWYLVMDYVEGETLEKRLERARKGRLPLDEALDITRQLCNVLEYLHGQSRPVVFRDLKPSNVMLTPNGEVKLIDFGIARFFKPGKAKDTVNLGTPGYAAPEQYGGQGQSDPRTDVYSLGVLLHQMVTGYDPSTASTPFPLPPAGSIARNLPQHVEETISRATRVQPNLRFPSVKDLRNALFPPTWVMPPKREANAQSYATPQAQPTSSGAFSNMGKGVWIGLGFAGIVLLGLCALVAVGVVAGPDLFEEIAGRPKTLPPTTEIPLPTNTTTNPSAANPTLTPEPIELTQSAVQPTFTPSSASFRIVYVHGAVGDTDIYVANADGSEPKCVTCRGCDEAEPAWSPDGQYIIYQSNCGGSYDIWRINSHGGEPTQLTRTSNTDEREPDWSPDGSQIVFRSSTLGSDRNADGELRVMDTNGDNKHSLGIQGRTPGWSPDGRKIAFMSERSGSWEIYIYDTQSRNTHRLTTCSSNCRWPAWSPDGRYVIYHSTTGPGSVTAETIQYTIASGGSTMQLVSGHHPGRPTWSSRGWIAFNSDRGIEEIHKDGSGRRTLISSERNWAPVWSK